MRQVNIVHIITHSITIKHNILILCFFIGLGFTKCSPPFSIPDKNFVYISYLPTLVTYSWRFILICIVIYLQWKLQNMKHFIIMFSLNVLLFYSSRWFLAVLFSNSTNPSSCVRARDRVRSMQESIWNNLYKKEQNCSNTELLNTTSGKHIGEWRYISTVLQIGTKRRWVVTLTLQPL
jgi:hypothetical protein